MRIGPQVLSLVFNARTFICSSVRFLLADGLPPNTTGSRQLPTQAFA